MGVEEKPRKKIQLNVKKSEHKFARILQIIARIIAAIGSLAAIAISGLFFAVFYMNGIFLGFIFIALCPMIGKLYTTSLREELVGGILLIFEAIGFMLFLLLYAKWISGLDLFITLLIGVPLIISGIIFIIAWYLEKYRVEYPQL